MRVFENFLRILLKIALSAARIVLKKNLKNCIENLGFFAKFLSLRIFEFFCEFLRILFENVFLKVVLSAARIVLRKILKDIIENF